MVRFLNTCVLVTSCILGGVTMSVAQTAAKPAAKPAPAKTTSSKPAPVKPAVAKQVSTVPAVIELKTSLDSVAYSLGLNIGESFKMQGLTDLNTKILEEGIRSVIKEGAQPRISQEVAHTILMSHFKQMEDALRKAEDAKSEPNRIAGENFLAENKKKEGVVTTESGLQYKVLKMGEGPKPTGSDRVKAHYTGTLIDGTVFDSSIQRGEPIDFSVGGVIKGWTEALQLMPVGSKWMLFIPYELAYGERAAGPTIAAKSALVFEVELLEILKTE